MRVTYWSRSAYGPIVSAFTCLGLASSAFAQTPAPQPAAPVTAAPAEPAAPPPTAAPTAPEATPPTLAPVSPGFPTPETQPASVAPPAPPVVEAPPTAAPAEPDPNAGIVSFKPGKGLDVKSNDGNFSLNVRLKTQLLDEVHKTRDAKKATNDFFVRRMRLAFQGNVFSKNVKYKIEMTFAAAEMGRAQPRTAETLPNVDPTKPAAAATLDRDVITQSPLLDVYFDLTHVRDLNVRIGQSKVPFGRERMLSDNEMIVPDRSLEDTAFNFDRDMGIDIRSNDFLGLNLLHYYLGVYLAEERNATFTSLGRGDLGLLYNVRLEFVPFGNFEEVATDFDRGAPKLSLGVAYAFLQSDAISTAYRPDVLGGTLEGSKLTDQAKIDYNAHNFTADLLFKGAGFTLLSAFHYRKAVDLPRAITKARNGLGFVIQGAYLLSNEVPLELQANLGLIRPVDKDTSNLVGNNELGGGFNYYFNKHGIKVMAEVSRIFYEDRAQRSRNDTRVRLLLQVLL